jgi:LysR family nitrogen assimilation transcriptional regulator
MGLPDIAQIYGDFTYFMELNHLKYFYTVAREGSFTRASKILRIQQPTISKMVQLLEQQLDTVLFERHKRGVRLTDAGAEVLAICENIFSQVEAIREFSEQQSTECQGLLSFGMTDSIVVYLLPGIINGFLKKHPKVRPSIFAGSSNLISNEIREGRAEFGVFYTRPDKVDFEISEMLNIPFSLVIATQQAKSQTVKSRLIISRDIDYPKARPFPVLEMLNRNKVKADIFVTSNNLDSQKRMVMEGLGVALLPRFMVKQEITKGQLTELLPRKDFVYSLKLVTKHRKVLSRNALVFLEEFKSRMKSLV